MRTNQLFLFDIKDHKPLVYTSAALLETKDLEESGPMWDGTAPEVIEAGELEKPPFELDSADDGDDDQKIPQRHRSFAIDPKAQLRARQEREANIALARGLSREDLILPEHNGHWTPATAEGFEPGHPGANPFDYPRSAAEVASRDLNGFMFEDYNLLGGNARGLKNPVKRRAAIEAAIQQTLVEIERDSARYDDLLLNGVASLSDFDLIMQPPGDAWRTALALKFNHLRYEKSRLLALEAALSELNSSGNAQELVIKSAAFAA
jgi:hypothetical protein